MWLIDTATYVLTFFASADDVEYAILSHTWGDDEVVFRDMKDLEKAKKKAGWAKIEKSCLLALAREPPIMHAWVDTCCIDKTSSAELSEAINSMFDWYRGSTVCFVHLQDFSVSTLGADAQDHEGMAFQAALHDCRWFKRGWTLQELVASEFIDFHDERWSYVGDKQILRPLLSHITGINEDVLASIDDLWSIPVGIRMSWAAARETSREEDVAYCLLGIFNVNLPLLYGEGSKAFLRLQDEIARCCNDLTLFAWQQVDTSRSAQFRGIYAESPAEFVNCASLRVPKEKFTWDNEFTLTNRGLRFDRNLAVGGPRRNFITDDSTGHDFIMGLDCLERSGRTNSTPKWVGIHLWRIGNTYIRYLADTLHYASSRTQWRSPEARKRVAYVPRTISALDASFIEHTVSISIVYDDVMRTIVDEALVPTKRVLLRHLESDHVHEVDAFEAQGLESLVRLHVVEAQLGHQTARLALVCGHQIRPHAAYAAKPWALLFHEEQLSHLRDHRVSNSDLFNPRPDSSLTPEEKLGRFRDYIFETYSDAQGYLKEDEMGATAEILDSRNERETHTFTAVVQEEEELMWEPSGPSQNFHVMLTYEHGMTPYSDVPWRLGQGDTVDVLSFLVVPDSEHS